MNEQLLDKLDEMVRDMDSHNYSPNDKVYGELTFKDLIDLTVLVRKNYSSTKDYYIDLFISE